MALGGTAKRPGIIPSGYGGTSSSIYGGGTAHDSAPAH